MTRGSILRIGWHVPEAAFCNSPRAMSMMEIGMDKEVQVPEGVGVRIFAAADGGFSALLQPILPDFAVR